MSKSSYNDTQYRQKCRQKWTVCSYKSFLSQYAHSFMALDTTSNIWSMFCSMFVLLLFCFSFFWLMILNNVCYIYWIFNWMFKRKLRILREMTVRHPSQITAIIISGCILDTLCVVICGVYHFCLSVLSFMHPAYFSNWV